MWLACFAAGASRDPIRFPTRVDAATPANELLSLEGCTKYGVRLLTDTERDCIKNCALVSDRIIMLL